MVLVGAWDLIAIVDLTVIDREALNVVQFNESVVSQSLLALLFFSA